MKQFRPQGEKPFDTQRAERYENKKPIHPCKTTRVRRSDRLTRTSIGTRRDRV